jgi:cysteine desulfurase/selenocysteine lyase
LDIKKLKEALTEDVKILAITHASNVLGTINPIKEICKIAHEKEVLVSVDGAQAVPHLGVNMQSLGCDFYSFSGHKMLGPTGIGVLYVNKEVLKDLKPSTFGGGMINEVGLRDSTWADVPQKFEAGTPNIAGAIGLAAAIEYLQSVGMENIRGHEKELVNYGLEHLGSIDGLEILGTKNAEDRTGLISFFMPKIHPHDIAAILSGENIAVRSGNHCAMPLHKKFGISGSARASFYLYNTKEDIDALVAGIKKVKEIML